MRLPLGLSPCPNDTFIFHALLHGRLDTRLPDGRRVEFDPVFADVEELNERMLRGELPVTKASFAALAQARDRYAVLRTGGALGRGNGPLLLAREPLDPADLSGLRVRVPGHLTTAALLLRTLHPELDPPDADRYDRLLPALLAGEIDVALVIHELRFTYREHGLHAVEDLGRRYERETGCAVPLGGIFVRRDVDPVLARHVEGWIGESLAWAREHPADCAEFVREHAQELGAEVTRAHIDLYVNEFSSGYGPEGEAAIRRLLELAVERGTAESSDRPLFVAHGG